MEHHDNQLNQLILAVSHQRLTAPTLTEIVQRTTTESVHTLSHIKNEILKQKSSSTSPSSAASTAAIQDSESRFDEYGRARVHERPQQVHLVFTGSPVGEKPGKSLDEREKYWSNGEQIFARLIDSIGMNHFHRLAKDDAAQLKAELVDVRQSDFAINAVGDSTVDVEMNIIAREVAWIANKTLQKLVRNKARRICKATILYPYEWGDKIDDHDKNAMLNTGKLQRIQTTIHDALTKEWADKEGPMNGVELCIEIIQYKI